MYWETVNHRGQIKNIKEVTEYKEKRVWSINGFQWKDKKINILFSFVGAVKDNKIFKNTTYITVF